MHVLMAMSGGLLLLGVFVLFGWLWGANAAGIELAATVFVPVWLLVAGVNMWAGVFLAGYSMREEFPILVLVFVIPAAAAVGVIWRLAQP